VKASLGDPTLIYYDITVITLL